MIFIALYYQLIITTHRYKYDTSSFVTTRRACISLNKWGEESTRTRGVCWVSTGTLLWEEHTAHTNKNIVVVVHLVAR